MVQTSLDQVIYGQWDETTREAMQRLHGLHYVLYPTGPMPVGLGTNTIIKTITFPDDVVWDQLHVFLSVTAAAAAAGDKLDIYIDSSMDDGATWFNVIHFAQILGTSVVPYKALACSNVTAATYANVTNDAAPGATPNPWAGSMMRLRATLTDAGTAAFSFGVYAMIH